MVGLAAAEVAAELRRPLVDARLELGHGQHSVERRVAPREHVEIDAVEDDHLHGAALYSAISASNSARTSSAGRVSTTGPPSLSRTRRSSPPRAFLSRC